MTDPSGGCAFCRIAAEQKYVVCWDYSTRHPGLQVISFAPLNPVTPGHMLFVPDIHLETARDNPMVTGLTFETASRYACQQDEDFNLIVNAGAHAEQTVYHLHVHYVPRRPGDGLDLPWTKQHDRKAPVAGSIQVHHDPMRERDGSARIITVRDGRFPPMRP
jgi:histidine triad (HIT) family protein